jgi:hypothetical protein
MTGFLIASAILVIAYLIFSFFKGVANDAKDLQGIELKDKFAAIVQTLDDNAFGGMADINVVDKLNFNLHRDSQSQIIKFYYESGALTVQWKYKFIQQEVICEKKLRNASQASVMEQIEFAQGLTREMNGKMAQLQGKVWGGMQ